MVKKELEDRKKLKDNKKEYNDKKCPFHGNVKTHGRKLKGVVIARDAHGTANVELIRVKKIKKYERFEKRRSRIKAHNPKCIDANKGDVVLVMECRPLSKTKHFVIVKKLGKERLFKQREEALEEGKFKRKEKEEKNIKKEMEGKESLEENESTQS